MSAGHAEKRDPPAAAASIQDHDEEDRAHENIALAYAPAPSAIVVQHGYIQPAEPAPAAGGNDLFRGLHRPVIPRAPTESSRPKIGFRITPRMVLPSSARRKQHQKATDGAAAPIPSTLHSTTSATAFLPRSMRVGHGIGAYAPAASSDGTMGNGKQDGKQPSRKYRDDQFEADRDNYLETLRGIRLLQRFVRRRRWRVLFGAKHIPLIHGCCGLTAWPIFVRNKLEGMEGPSGQLYRGVSLGCLGIRSPLRVGAIFLVEWPWFDRLSLLAVMVNCVVLALQGPPGSYTYIPTEAAVREVEFAFTLIFTGELLAVREIRAESMRVKHAPAHVSSCACSFALPYASHLGLARRVAHRIRAAAYSCDPVLAR